MNKEKFSVIAISITGIIAVVLISMIFVPIIISKNTADTADVSFIENTPISTSVYNNVMVGYEWGKSPVYYTDNIEQTIELDHPTVPSRYREYESAFSVSEIQKFDSDDYKIYALNRNVINELTSGALAFECVFFANIDVSEPAILVCNGAQICQIPIVARGVDQYYYKTTVIISPYDEEYEFLVKHGKNISNKVIINIKDKKAQITGSKQPPAYKEESKKETPDPVKAPEWKKDDTAKEHINKATSVTEPATRSNIKTYIDYMTSTVDDKNAVFSPESLNSALCLYGKLADNEGSNSINDFIGDIDYLQYNNSGAFKMFNRLWLNSNKNFNVACIDIDKDIIYEIDMKKEDATAEKDKWVSEQTSGFITSTPSVFNDNVYLDAMNVVYFKDKWLDGDKPLSDTDYVFHNADNTETPVKMIMDSGKTGRRTKNAMSYTMTYADGFTFTAVVPNEDINIEDVDLERFINNSPEYVNNKVEFYMPEFEIENTYDITCGEFGINPGSIREDVLDLSNVAFPKIGQIAKVKVDHTGTEAAAVSEFKVMYGLAPDKEEPIELICDRPFYFYITDELNKDIAFIGIVNKL